MGWWLRDTDRTGKLELNIVGFGLSMGLIDYKRESIHFIQILNIFTQVLHCTKIAFFF